MKIAVTGGSGYVGGVLCRYLRKCGFDVTSFSRRRVDGGWTPYSLDMDPVTLHLTEFDIVIHAAYDFSARGFDEVFLRNVEPSIKLLQAAKKFGVPKFIFISSISSFSGCKSTYGKAKFSIEQVVLKQGGIVIRPGLVWGAHPGGVMGALEKMVHSLPVIPCLIGDPQPSQYLVHEDDLGHCVSEFCKKENVKATLHSAASPKAVTIQHILRTIAGKASLKRIFIPISWKPVLLGLKIMEACRTPTLFRSDSLTGMVYRSETVEGVPPPAGVEYRCFLQTAASHL